MKTTQLLASLEQRIAELDRLIAPIAEHSSLTLRFDHQRFRTTEGRMQDYLDEVHYHLKQLRHCVIGRENEQVAWLAQKLVDQIACLQREAATWPLRRHDSAHSGLSKLHNKLLEHQEFERRLLEMKHDREMRVRNEETLVAQQQLHREIDALEGRVMRCRNAVYKIERALARINR